MLQDCPERSRECYYYLALGYFHLQEYALAKKYVQALLTLEPENLQAITLLDQINSKVTKSTYIF